MSVNPISFLESVSGYTDSQKRNGSADRPIKLAVIDPAYDPESFPGTLPRVTFEGESTLSGKFYAVASPYWPHPGDKVWMVPIASTYLIVGSRQAGQGAVYLENAGIPTTGTYTPVITSDTTDLAPGADGFFDGKWMRVGRQITVNVDVLIQGTGANFGGASTRVGLPFAADLTFHSAGVLRAASDCIGVFKTRSGDTDSGQPLAPPKGGVVLLSAASQTILYSDDSITSMGEPEIFRTASSDGNRLKMQVTYLAST